MTATDNTHEELTSVAAVQKALNDDRVVECVPPGDSHQWLQTFMDKPEVIASDLMAGWQYRAPAASVGDAPSDAVAYITTLRRMLDWVPGDEQKSAIATVLMLNQYAINCGFSGIEQALINLRIWNNEVKAVQALVDAAESSYPPADYTQDAHGFAVRTALDALKESEDYP